MTPQRFINETCRCGAGFGAGDAEESYLVNCYNLWQRWQDQHALICDSMRLQIQEDRAEKNARLEESKARTEERLAKQRASNARSKAKKAAVPS